MICPISRTPIRCGHQAVSNWPPCWRRAIRFAIQLCRLSSSLSPYLTSVEAVLKKPMNQDVMVELMHALDQHAAALSLGEYKLDVIEDIVRMAEAMTGGEVDAGGDASQSLQCLLQVCPECTHHARAMLVLALLGEAVLNPVFSRTDAIGTAMRKKLKPLTEPIHATIKHSELPGRRS